MEKKEFEVERLGASEILKLNQKEMTVDNESYFDLQHCEGIDEIREQKIEIGAYLEGVRCPDVIIWYQSPTDFEENLSDRSSTMDGATNDVENTARFLQFSTVTNLTYNRTVSIKVKQGSALFEKFREITMRDKIEGYDGQLIKQYMNHGFHMRLTTLSADGESSVQQIALNLLLTNWVDVDFLNPNIEDASQELNFQINYWPDYVVTGDVTDGSLPEKYNVNFNLEKMKIETTASEMYISGVEFTDAFGITEDNVYRVYVQDEKGTTIASSEESVKAGETAKLKGEFVDGETYYVKFGVVYGDKEGTKSSKFIHVNDVVRYVAKVEEPTEPASEKKTKNKSK